MHRIRRPSCGALALLLAIQLLLTGCSAVPPEPVPAVTEAAPAPPQTVPETAIPETLPPVQATEAATQPPQADPTEPPVTEPATAKPLIPLYDQNDYPEVRYGSGTIQDNGCSITALAMVATYLTGHTYFPDQLARWFGGDGDNNMEHLEYGSDMMQLPYKKNTNWHVTLNALRQGKIAIALMDERSAFTTSQHFIVLTGVTEEGRILVMDPNSKNYHVWALKQGFERGFEQWQIVEGICGSWVYDKAAMPAEPFVYSEPELDRSSSRYEGIKFSQRELDLLACLIWVEAQGEPFQGQQAVAEVVFNRLYSEKYAKTLRGVIYDEGQFRSVPFLMDAKPVQEQYDAIDMALYGEPVLPMDVMYFSTSTSSRKVWGKIGGHIFWYPEDYAGEIERAPRAKNQGR